MKAPAAGRAMGPAMAPVMAQAADLVTAQVARPDNAQARDSAVKLARVQVQGAVPETDQGEERVAVPAQHHHTAARQPSWIPPADLA